MSRIEISSGQYRPLPITTRMKFERLARLISPHRLIRDFVWLSLPHRGKSYEQLRRFGFKEVHFQIEDSLVSQIEDAVSEFENVLFGKAALESMPDGWQREYRKTHNQPLRHVPIEHRPEILTAIRMFLASPLIYATAYKYFVARPILKNIRVLYSQNTSEVNVESQQFHRDPEGSKQLKVFVAVRDVSTQSGPLTVLGRADSDSVISNASEHVRYTDEVVERSVPVERWKSCIGPSGTTWLVDTSNCLHFGSRRGSHPRILLYAQLLPWYSAILPGRNPLRTGYWLNRPPGSDLKRKRLIPWSRGIPAT